MVTVAEGFINCVIYGHLNRHLTADGRRREGYGVDGDDVGTTTGESGEGADRSGGALEIA